MVLASLSEMVNSEQGPIAGYLTVAVGTRQNEYLLLVF
jgi:hypothetical protein